MPKSLKALKKKTIDNKKSLKTLDITNIQSIKERANEKLVFSFELFDRSHKYFNLGNTCVEWYVALIDVLKHLSSLTWNQLTQEYFHTYQPHNYDWDKCNFKFMLDDVTLKQSNPYQIRISKSKGRIHGLLVGNRFYVYWLDPHHNMYNGKRYEKAVAYPEQLSCFETQTNIIKELNEKIIYLKDEIKIYDELMEEAGVGDQNIIDENSK